MCICELGEFSVGKISKDGEDDFDSDNNSNFPLSHFKEWYDIPILKYCMPTLLHNILCFCSVLNKYNSCYNVKSDCISFINIENMYKI